MTIFQQEGNYPSSLSPGHAWPPQPTPSSAVHQQGMQPHQSPMEQARRYAHSSQPELYTSSQRMQHIHGGFDGSFAGQHAPVFYQSHQGMSQHPYTYPSGYSHWPQEMFDGTPYTPYPQAIQYPPIPTSPTFHTHHPQHSGYYSSQNMQVLPRSPTMQPQFAWGGSGQPTTGPTTRSVHGPALPSPTSDVSQSRLHIQGSTIKSPPPPPPNLWRPSSTQKIQLSKPASGSPPTVSSKPAISRAVSASNLDSNAARFVPDGGKNTTKSELLPQKEEASAAALPGSWKEFQAETPVQAEKKKGFLGIANKAEDRKATETSAKSKLEGTSKTLPPVSEIITPQPSTDKAIPKDASKTTLPLVSLYSTSSLASDKPKPQDAYKPAPPAVSQISSSPSANEKAIPHEAYRILPPASSNTTSASANKEPAVFDLLGLGFGDLGATSPTPATASKQNWLDDLAEAFGTNILSQNGSEQAVAEICRATIDDSIEKAAEKGGNRRDKMNSLLDMDYHTAKEEDEEISTPTDIGYPDKGSEEDEISLPTMMASPADYPWDVMFLAPMSTGTSSRWSSRSEPRSPVMLPSEDLAYQDLVGTLADYLAETTLGDREHNEMTPIGQMQSLPDSPRSGSTVFMDIDDSFVQPSEAEVSLIAGTEIYSNLGTSRDIATSSTALLGSPGTTTDHSLLDFSSFEEVATPTGLKTAKQASTEAYANLISSRAAKRAANEAIIAAKKAAKATKTLTAPGSKANSATAATTIKKPQLANAVPLPPRKGQAVRPPKAVMDAHYAKQKWTGPLPPLTTKERVTRALGESAETKSKEPSPSTAAKSAAPSRTSVQPATALPAQRPHFVGPRWASARKNYMPQVVTKPPSPHPGPRVSSADNVSQASFAVIRSNTGNPPSRPASRLSISTEATLSTDNNNERVHSILDSDRSAIAADKRAKKSKLEQMRLERMAMIESGTRNASTVTHTPPNNHQGTQKSGFRPDSTSSQGGEKVIQTKQSSPSPSTTSGASKTRKRKEAGEGMRQMTESRMKNAQKVYQAREETAAQGRLLPLALSAPGPAKTLVPQSSAHAIPAQPQPRRQTMVVDLPERAITEIVDILAAAVDKAGGYAKKLVNATDEELDLIALGLVNQMFRAAVGRVRFYRMRVCRSWEGMLKGLRRDSLRHIKHLSIDVWTKPTTSFSNPWDLVAACPNLFSLTVGGGFTFLRVPLAVRWKNLRTIRVRMGAKRYFLSDFDSKPFPNLQTLHIESALDLVNYKETDRKIDFSNLRILHINSMIPVGEMVESLRWFCFPKLKYLQLQLGAQAFCMLKEGVWKLQVERNTRTMAALAKWCTHLTKLRQFRLQVFISNHGNNRSLWTGPTLYQSVPTSRDMENLAQEVVSAGLGVEQLYYSVLATGGLGRLVTDSTSDGDSLKAELGTTTVIGDDRIVFKRWRCAVGDEMGDADNGDSEVQKSKVPLVVTDEEGREQCGDEVLNDPQMEINFEPAWDRTVDC